MLFFLPIDAPLGYAIGYLGQNKTQYLKMFDLYRENISLDFLYIFNNLVNLYNNFADLSINTNEIEEILHRLEMESEPIDFGGMYITKR